MMRIFRVFLFWSLLLPLAASSALFAQSKSLTLDQILARVEERGKTLHALEADLVQRKWTDILQEFDAGESGRFQFLKEKGEVYLRKDIAQPQPNYLVIREGEVIFYQPAIKQAQQHQLGDSKDKAEFLLLGFGTSRENLEKAYQIASLGQEPVSGRPAYVVELTPRSEQVSAYFSKIVLWVSADLWVPIQQKLVEPTDDFLEVRFENVKLNPKLSPKDFELKIPKDVKVVGN